MPIVSVIIPTRERVETLIHSIKTALDQSSNEYEVLVGDNFSEDATKLEIQKINDNRLRYINSGVRLSMSDNWEFCLKQARGRYIVFIGDDDAIVPGAIDALIEIIKGHNYKFDSYAWITSTYIWPIENNEARLDFISKGNSSGLMNLKKLGQFTQKYGGWMYYKLPGAYHAAVKKSIFDSIAEKTGRVFHTTQPDIFTSISVAALSESCYKLAQPISIQGRSAKSNGGSSIASDGAKNLERYQREFGGYRLHPSLNPKIAYSGMLIVDGIIRAMEFFPDTYPKDRFNYDAMWAFLNRIGIISAKEIIFNFKEINFRKNLSLSKIIYFISVHKLLALRRSFINLISRQDLHNNIPENIHLYAKYLGLKSSKDYL
jgi:glycosyltransferase involved in cell wall biosynthesis